MENRYKQRVFYTLDASTRALGATRSVFKLRRQLLCVDPADRLSQGCLHHPWMEEKDSGHVEACEADRSRYMLYYIILYHIILYYIILYYIV